ncbi:Bromodomain-containing protein [Ganoderma leucocontextum]|nr:Bromodomain-containing protein [Ganoderma leucocontextum]
MSKREARSFAAEGVDIDAPRAKRRKEAPATSSASPERKHDAEGHKSKGDANGAAEDAGAVVKDKEEVRLEGLQLWQTLKDTVNKEGQIASFQFMRLPSKRQYPDYYVQIKRPIALDDIKSKLETREYATLDAVRQDFETCFRNAKRYNMKESQIFKDAKFLHKLFIKEYNRLAGKDEDPHDGEGSDDENGEKKKKAPNLSRLLKTRLQKLVDRTDDKGRVLSAEFMELPNRKQWPMYYTIIKKPQCLDNIFKTLKRKEYHKPIDFTNDVELVFSNALEFNQEHTQIWDDAVALREYFRKLISDLPEPFAIPAYANSSEHPTKIKLKMKMPQSPAPAQPIAAPAPSLPSANSIFVGRSHAASSSNLQTQTKQDVKPAVVGSSPQLQANTVKSPSVTPAIAPAPVPPSIRAVSSQASSSTPAIAPTPSLPVPQAQKHASAGSLQPPGYLHGATSNGGATYRPSQQPTLAPAPPKAPSKPSALPVAIAPAPALAAAAARPSPPTANQYAHPLKHAVITTLPPCRRLVLDHSDGVRTWAMRLDGTETSIVVSDVAFLSHDEHEESDEDAPMRQEEEEEEEEEEGAGAEAEPASPSKRKGLGRPSRKRTRSARILNSKKGKGKGSESLPGPIQVKLNGAVLKANDGGTWETAVLPSLNMLEVGEKGGTVWKVYLDKVVY